MLRTMEINFHSMITFREEQTTLTFGLSCWHHALNCAFRSRSSVYQKPKVVDSQEILFQDAEKNNIDYALNIYDWLWVSRLDKS